MKIYVASSWRNNEQPGVVRLLREAGHEVYDFRNPPKSTGFQWSEIDPKWQEWTPRDFRRALEHRRAVEGFQSDFQAMQEADAMVLVLPCGRSAHLELGWAVGAGKPTCILMAPNQEPELMYRMVGSIRLDLKALVRWCSEVQEKLEQMDRLERSLRDYDDEEIPF